MLNTNNYGTAMGLLKDVPNIIPNKDRSKKVFLTLLVTNTDETTKQTQEIPFQGFIPNTFKGDGPYGYLKKNEPVRVLYNIKANPYDDGNAIILQIDSIQFGKNLEKPILPNELRTAMNNDIQTVATTTSDITTMSQVSTSDVSEEFNDDLDFYIEE